MRTGDKPNWAGPWRLVILMDHPRTQHLMWMRRYYSGKVIWGRRLTADAQGPIVTRIWN